MKLALLALKASKGSVVPRGYKGHEETVERRGRPVHKGLRASRVPRAFKGRWGLRHLRR